MITVSKILCTRFILHRSETVALVELSTDYDPSLLYAIISTVELTLGGVVLLSHCKMHSKTFDRVWRAWVRKVCDGTAIDENEVQAIRALVKENLSIA